MDELASLINSGNLYLALRKLKEMVAQNPSRESYSLLGRVLLELGKDEEALEAFMKAGDAESAAKILITQGNLDKAMSLLEGKNSKDARVLRALIMMRSEKFDYALKELEGKEEDLKDEPIYHKVKGISEYATKRFYEALRDLTRGIMLYPLDAELYYYRALVKMALGDEAGAEKDLDSAINLNPYYAEAYLSKGIIRENRGDATGAISLYSRSIEIKPDYKEAYLRRSKAYSKLGRTEEALKDEERFRELK